MSYVFCPKPNQLDGVMQPMNPLDSGHEGYSAFLHHFALAGIDDTTMPMASRILRNDLTTPTVDIFTSNQFAMPALNGGLGAVQDAINVLAVVDLLTR